MYLVTFLLIVGVNPKKPQNCVSLPYHGPACELSNISQIKSSQVVSSGSLLTRTLYRLFYLPPALYQQK